MTIQRTIASIPTGPVPLRGRVRVRTLVHTRWIAVLGQLSMVMVAYEGLAIEIPLILALLGVACSATLNIWVTVKHGLSGWYSDRSAARFLAYDLFQLSWMLYLTGGLTNPFAILFLVPVTISATILSLGSTLGLGLVTFVCISFLSIEYRPLPWPDADLLLPPIYLLGLWGSISLSMAFLIFYVWRVAEEARRMSDALAETQSVLSREQEMSSLGALAAAAAHELGTPLGTIALIAEELTGEFPLDSEAGQDMALLARQVERCRDILAQLAKNPRQHEDASISQLSIDAFAAFMADRHRRNSIEFDLSSTGDGRPPLVKRTAELVQGLGNFIDNAADFASKHVEIETRWDEMNVCLTISDDGPGFSSGVLGLLGDPYISTRSMSGRMGLGVFISKTLLERTGASIRFSNRGTEGGAVVAITWSRHMIEVFRAPAT